MTTLQDALQGRSPLESDYGTTNESQPMLRRTNASPRLVFEDRKDKTKDKGMAIFIQNVVMGASDGFTVPFALAAGLTTTVSSSRLIVIAVVAELAAGLIAMGLGGYMAAHAERVFHRTAKETMMQKVESNSDEIKKMFVDILQPIGIPMENIDMSFEKLREDPEKCVDFILKHELAADEEGMSDPIKSGATVGISYVIAGALPMIPYLIFASARQALIVSVVVGLVTMFAFGWVKAILLGGDRRASAIQTALLGAIAATASYLLAGSFS